MEQALSEGPMHTTQRDVTIQRSKSEISIGTVACIPIPHRGQVGSFPKEEVSTFKDLQLSDPDFPKP